jgi:ATP-dependent DNA ligase
MLKRKYGPKREEVVGSWKRLHNEHNFYTSPNIIRTITSRERQEVHTKFWLENLQEGD